MASQLKVDELFKRAVDLNVRYYTGMSQLMTNYVWDLVTTFTDLSTTRPPASEQRPRSNPSAQKTQQTPVMVMEAELGKDAVGVFLVENHLGHEISTRPATSAFVDAAHHEIKPLLVFDPEAIVLRPGEQVLVRVKAHIDETLEPGVRYEGAVYIPDLAGSKVGIVLRRRAVSAGLSE